MSNGATFAPGLSGQAFFLDGIDDFVDLGNASTLHVSAGDFTVDAWVLFNALGHPPGANTGAPQGDMSIVDKMSTSGVNTDGWRLLKQNDNRFWFCLGGGASGNRCFDSAYTVFSTTRAVTGVWFHVAAVKHASSFAIYVNGVLEDIRSPVPSFLDTNSANLRIGSYVLEGSHLNGLIDEVTLYNRALSAAEIAAIYDAGQAGKCKAGAVIANAGPDQRVPVGATVRLDGSGSKSLDGKPLSYHWVLRSVPSGSTAVLSDATVVNPTFVADLPGAYSAQLVVTDGTHDSAPATVTITAVNRPPTITSTPPTSSPVGQLYTYDVDATDPDAGDVLTFSLTAAPMGMNINATTGLVQWTPTAAQVGSHSVTVRVQDTGGLAAMQDFAITVPQPNRPPLITSTPGTTATVGLPYSYDVEATDPDTGDVLTFSLTTAPTGMTINAATGLIQWTPTAGQVGDHAVTVQVQDTGGLTATQSFMITVLQPNRPPQITSTPVTTATVGQPYSYDVEATDPDAGDVLTFSLSSVPEGMTIDPTTGLIQWTPTVAQVGIHQVMVYVQDAGGLSATQSFPVSVRQPPVITSTPTIAHWMQVTPTGMPPKERYWAGAQAYDEINDRLMLFSGEDNSSIHPHTADVWVLANATGARGSPTWQQIEPKNTGPTGRMVFSSVYDPIANRLIIYGGCLSHCAPAQSDVWVLTNANGLGGQSEWLQLPSGDVRAFHVAGYDPVSNRMVVFGGNTGFPGDKNDVWVFIDTNGIGVPQWISLAPAGTPPAPRGHVAVGVYDPLSNRLMLFGGSTSTAAVHLNDVWVLTHANGLGGTPTWIQLAPIDGPPTARGNHSVVYDPNSNRLVAFGGDHSTSTGMDTFFNDTWVLSHANGNGGIPQWVQPNTVGKPPARSSHSVGYARASNRMVIAGGRNDFIPAPGAFNDVWVLTNASGQCTAGQPCNYAVEATDPDVGDTLTFSLDTAPVGMTINASTGLLEWTPTPAQIGDHSVTVRVQDSGGLSDTQSFVLTVVTAAATNQNLVARNDIYTIGEEATLTVASPGVLANDWDADGHPLTTLL